MSRDLDTVSESHGGLLAHIIDSRVAARDAPALLCPVERWQEAWFRDNSFLIACLIHTIRNYTAVPCAYARSRNHSREHPGTRPFRTRLLALLRARAPLFCFRRFSGRSRRVLDFVNFTTRRAYDLRERGEILFG